MNLLPVHQLQQAQAALVEQLTAAADQLDNIGAGNLDAAMARLKASAEAAAARLARAGQAVQQLAGDVLAQVLALTADLAPPPAPTSPPAAPAAASKAMPTEESAPTAPAQIAEPTPAVSIGHHEPGVSAFAELEALDESFDLGQEPAAVVPFPSAPSGGMERDDRRPPPQPQTNGRHRPARKPR